MGSKFDEPFCCTTVRVTRTAVSVVICMGPSLLPLKPFFRNSDVLSILDLVPTLYPNDPSSLPRGGSSPDLKSQPRHFTSITPWAHTQDSTKQKDVEFSPIFRTQLNSGGWIKQAYPSLLVLEEFFYTQMLYYQTFKISKLWWQ